MITQEEKIEIIINRLNNLESMMESFINNAESCKDKYSLEDELAICNLKKEAMLKILNELGGSLPSINK